MNFARFLKGSFFTEQWMTASILQRLLALHFAIIYGWQLSSNEKSLLGKNSFIYFNDFRDLYFFCTDIFSQMPVYLVGYVKRMLFQKTQCF